MKTEFDDYLMDAKIGIKTVGRIDVFADDFSYPYEPTTYSVLERVVESGYISEDDFLVDYGAGKGRVAIYLNHRIGCKACGIELIEAFVNDAIENVNAIGKENEIFFAWGKAQQWEVPTEATCLFFFNPFSIEILEGVMSQILDSYYANPRKIRLFFYYPQMEYIAYLMGIDELEFFDEIDCKDLFEKKDDRNRIMIFET